MTAQGGNSPPFIINILSLERHATEVRIKESYYWQQADKKVRKAAAMAEKEVPVFGPSLLAFPDTSVRRMRIVQ